MGVTKYSGISKFYFDALLKKIIDVGNLHKDKILILDFGCGNGRLKKMIGKSVINFDKRSDLTDVKDWTDIDFNFFIANHVLYELDESELNQLCLTLSEHLSMRNFTIIIGIARQGILSKFGKLLLNQKNAHSDTKTSPSTQIKILKNYFKINKNINFWFLTQIFVITELN